MEAEGVGLNRSSGSANATQARTMKHRQLRIVWSAWWAILAALLVVLWVRTYHWVDVVTGETPTHKWNFVSTLGRLGMSVGPGRFPPTTSPEEILSEGWKCFTKPVGDQRRRQHGILFPTFDFGWRGFSFGWGAGAIGLTVPFWATVPFAIACAILPWSRYLSYRFSLRTLLIAMALVAVALSQITWLPS